MGSATRYAGVQTPIEKVYEDEDFRLGRALNRSRRLVESGGWNSWRKLAEVSYVIRPVCDSSRTGKLLTECLAKSGR